MSVLKYIYLFLFFIVSSTSLFSAPTNATDALQELAFTRISEANFNFSIEKNHDRTEKKFFRIGKRIFRNPFYKSPNRFLQDKVSTVCIILLTGPLGGHRLYLGTKPVVPVVYAVTLGGGIGILPIIDMFVVIFTKDLNRYINNDKIIMWID
jgi:hypothetical protein